MSQKQWSAKGSKQSYPGAEAVLDLVTPREVLLSPRSQSLLFNPKRMHLKFLCTKLLPLIRQFHQYHQPREFSTSLISRIPGIDEHQCWYSVRHNLRKRRAPPSWLNAPRLPVHYPWDGRRVNVDATAGEC